MNTKPIVNDSENNFDKLLNCSRSLVEIIIKTSSNAVLFFDTNGNCLYINPLGQRIIGLSPHRINTLNLFNFVDESQKECLDRGETIDLKITSNEIETSISDLVIMVRISPTLDDGQITGYLAIFTDISELSKKDTLLKIQNIQLNRLNTYVSHILKESSVSLWRIYFETNDPRSVRGEILMGETDIVQKNSFTFNEVINCLQTEEHEPFSRFLSLLFNIKNTKQTISDKIKVHHPRKMMTTYYTFTATHIEVGEKSEILCTFFDITDIMTKKQELEYSNMKYKLLIQGGGLVPWEFNVASQYTVVENVMENYVITADHLKEYIDRIIGPTKDKVKRIYQRILSGDDFSEMYEYSYNKEGKVTYISIYFTPKSMGKDGKVLEYVGYAKDITEVKLLIHQLEEAKLKAESADELKTKFLANMSHEIRTPLNAIVGFSEALTYAKTAEQKNKWQKYILSNSDMLLHLIGDILDLSKIEAGSISILNERFNFSEYFNDLFYMLRLKVENKNIEFIKSNPFLSLNIGGDKGRIGQIITNFTTNAIKYTSNGYIKLAYELIENNLKIIVKDSGCGISEEHQGRLFGRFDKLGSHIQGTGLGLAITKAIVNKMGGECGCDSTLGQGSLFWAIFPVEVYDSVYSSLNEEYKDVECQEKAELKLPKDLKVLVVDDNDGSRILFESMLENSNIMYARNGQEAVFYVKENEFDIIFMDIRMPVMNGNDAIKIIRTFNQDVPIIATTANAYDSDRIETLKAGANDFIAKPIRRAIVINTIYKHLTSKK